MEEPPQERLQRIADDSLFFAYLSHENAPTFQIELKKKSSEKRLNDVAPPNRIETGSQRVMDRFCALFSELS